MEKKKVIVVGAGFAGVTLSKKLDKNLFDVLLIDKLNHHQFQPLFYQVATSQIEPSSISFPIRNIFKNQNHVQVRMAEVLSIHQETNSISTTIGEFQYDYLVLAMGCKTNFFGNENISKHAFTLKSTYDAITIRNHILQVFEKMTHVSEEEKESLYNLIVVGAGPTGVELSGAFAEIKKHILPVDYPGIDFSKFKIFLVEGSNHTLNNMSEKSKKESETYLEKMGVTIIKNTFVQDYDGETIALNNGETIHSKTVIWAAGVIANTMEGMPEIAKLPGNRIKVDRQNKVEGSSNIFAIGDIANMPTEKYPKGHPQLANVAINQAKLLAKNLKAGLRSKPFQSFEYTDLGNMATIGRNKAVVDFPFMHIKGYFAWLIWMSLHLMLILSVRNKLIIFINWAWAYLTKDTSLRLILSPSKKVGSLAK
ncbi:MAG TPA: NAD(P)/FAD-dependent oxidoreductase [Flavobacteriaceae bacterium]|nr:NAD(P)/FAD-dependent oxidoreductase [Flavobacteriaceae bacterium]